MLEIPLRPDQVSKTRYTLDNSAVWVQIYSRQDQIIGEISVHNEGTQDVRIATKRSPSSKEWDTLSPDGWINFEFNPAEIWALRSSANSIPQVVVSYTYFSKPYVQAMKRIMDDMLMVTGGRR